MTSSGGESDKIEVTSEMVEAGARVLAEDGQMSEFSAQGIVAEIFRAMWAAGNFGGPLG